MNWRITFFFLCCIAMQGNSQDHYFSLFNYNRIYLNPAFTGHDFGWTISLNQKNTAIDGGLFRDNYEAYSLSSDWRIGQNGVGLFVMQAQEGDLPFTNRKAGLSFSRTLPIKKRQNKGKFRNVFLHLGGAVNYNEIRLDKFGDNVHFSDEIHAVNGFVFQTQAPLPYSSLTGIANKFFATADIGGILSWQFNRHTLQNWRFGVSYHNFGGFPHPDRPNEALFENGIAKRPNKLTLYFGGVMPNEKAMLSNFHTAFSPQIIYQRQGTRNLLVGGGYIFLKKEHSKKRLKGEGPYIGVFYHLPFSADNGCTQCVQSISAALGVNNTKGNFPISWALSVGTGLGPIKMGPTIETNIRFRFPDFRFSRKQPKANCKNCAVECPDFL